MSKKIKILLVDDMASMRGVVKMFLKDGGFNDIDEASNGEKAFKILKSNSYDIIICDWDMPVMSGLELLEKVRADDKTKDLPFIMLTANNQLEKIQSAIDKGVTDYIAKPFQAQRLIDMILKSTA